MNGPNDDEPVIVHTVPAIDDNCKHEWHYVQVSFDPEDIEPSYCTKCGISWTRYIFCQCP